MVKKIFIILRFSCLILFLSGISVTTLFAQYKISGRVIDRDKKPLKDVQILLSSKDSIVAMGLTNEQGNFGLSKIPQGDYFLSISLLGFSEQENFYHLDKDITNLEFLLLKDLDHTLDEVVVTAERRKQTATGEIYYLSSNAKKSGDPYKALSEIPRLRVNQALQSVKLDDGTSPYVLIDGKLVNTGITPIDPQDILSVEIVDVVNAKYLQKGIKTLLNIKLKPKRNPYQFYQVAARTDIPIREGFGVGYFEVGNSKVSLYGRASLSGTYNDDSQIEMWQKNTNYLKKASGTSRNNKQSLLGELILKWSLSEKDYMAAQLYGITTKQKQETWGSGSLKTTNDMSFLYRSINQNDSYVITAGLYYKHDFSKASNLEVMFGYNRNGNDNNGQRQEEYQSRNYLNEYIYDNSRSSANLDITYSKIWDNGSSLLIGSNTRVIHDNIEKKNENLPVFKHRRWDEYLYAGYGGRMGAWMYMVSGGLEYVYLQAATETNNYIRPRLSLSTNYQFNKKNNVRLSYKLTNQAPTEGQLNPYNTSTDPLVIVKGNSALTPQQQHSIQGSYTLKVHQFTFSPNVLYNLFTDVIEPYAYLEDNIQINTFRNSGKFARLAWGTNLRYNMKNRKGNCYVGGTRNTDYFTGFEAKHSWSVNAGLWLFLNKWTLGGDISWSDYTYTPYTQTKYLSPIYAQYQVNYNITPNLYIAIALQNFVRTLSNETFTQTGSFNSYHKVRMTDVSFCPWVLIRYTLRKNSNKKIRLENVIKSKEEGISL